MGPQIHFSLANALRLPVSHLPYGTVGGDKPKTFEEGRFYLSYSLLLTSDIRAAQLVQAPTARGTPTTSATSTTSTAATAAGPTSCSPTGRSASSAIPPRRFCPPSPPAPAAKRSSSPDDTDEPRNASQSAKRAVRHRAKDLCYFSPATICSSKAAASADGLLGLSLPRAAAWAR